MKTDVTKILNQLHQSIPISKINLLYLKVIGTVGPALTLIGSVLNLLALFIFLHPRNRYHSSFIFLAALSCADFVGLWTSFASQCLNQQYDIHVETYSVTGCKFHTFLVRVSIQFSACLLMALSTERLFEIMFTGRTKEVFSPRNTCIIIGVILSVLILLNIHVFRTYTIRNYYYNNITSIFTCEKIERWDGGVHRDFLYWIDVSLVTALPVVYLSIVSCALKVSLIKVKNNLEKSSMNSSKSSEFLSRMNDLLQHTSVVIRLNVWFIMCTAPSRIYIYLNEGEELGKKFYSKLMLLTIFFISSFASNWFNFIIYYFSFSKFKKDIHELLVKDS